MTTPSTTAAPVSAAAGSRTTFALWLDGILLLMFLVIQSPRVSGVMMHEVLGIAIAVPLIIHLLLSWHWIVSKARRLFTGASRRTRINYLINTVLFIAMVIAIVTGVVVSRAVMPAAGFDTFMDRDWFKVHDMSSNVLFGAIGLHLAMNWGWVLAAWRRRAFTAEEEAANLSDEGGTGE